MKPHTTTKKLTEFKNIMEVVDYFYDESFNLKYLEKLRWPEHISCPHCKHEKVYRFSDGITFKCAGCMKRFNAKTNHFTKGTKLSLQHWFVASFLFVSTGRGISSYSLARQLNITQKTAWIMLTKIRSSIERFYENDTTQLDGTIEIDETFVGGKNENRHMNKRYKYKKMQSWKGKDYPDKITVLGALERHGEVRCKVLKAGVTKKSVQPFLKSKIKQHSFLMSDKCSAYIGLGRFYKRFIVNHTKYQYVDGLAYTNSIENFWSIIKRAIIGVYYKISRKHANKYIQEFVFRYNTRGLSVADRFKKVLAV